MDTEKLKLKLGSFSKDELITELLAALMELAKRDDRLSKEDARTITCGLFPAGVNMDCLSSEAKREIRAAIEVVLTRTKLS